jgi:hypothetical protein
MWLGEVIRMLPAARGSAGQVIIVVGGLGPAFRLLSIWEETTS